MCAHHAYVWGPPNPQLSGMGEIDHCLQTSKKSANNNSSCQKNLDSEFANSWLKKKFRLATECYGCILKLINGTCYSGGHYWRLMFWCPVSKSSQYNWFEDRVPDLQISCSDLTRMGGYQCSNSRNGQQVTFSIECILIFSKWWYRFIPSTRSSPYNLKWIFTLILSIQWQSVLNCSSPIITLGRLPHTSGEMGPIFVAPCDSTCCVVYTGSLDCWDVLYILLFTKLTLMQ